MVIKIDVSAKNNCLKYLNPVLNGTISLGVNGILKHCRFSIISGKEAYYSIFLYLQTSYIVLELEITNATHVVIFPHEKSGRFFFNTSP